MCTHHMECLLYMLFDCQYLRLVPLTFVSLLCHDMIIEYICSADLEPEDCAEVYANTRGWIFSMVILGDYNKNQPPMEDPHKLQ